MAIREVIFRGKRKDNGEWVEGYYCNLGGNHPRVLKENIFIGKFGRVLEFENIDVLPETVGQYTGLTDKNGVKIFEGDIVKYQFDNDDCPFPNKRTDKIIGRIFFSDFRASFSVTAGKNGSSSMNNDLFKYVRNGNRVEVIGNIHDNPEFLKGDAK